ncbi:oligosaccharide flippase family protein [Candidatus Kaiserbacteria bacterium]|nr:oligosaccharide flippase family protein [Candidatus Kaiserbacteria bacterium]
MVRRVMNLMYKEVRGLHQAAYVLGIFAFGSQLLALIRDRMLAHEFGAGIELDLYYTAFRIPDLLYVIFASTLSVYVLIPFVAKRMQGDDSSEARYLLSQMFSIFLLVYTLVAGTFFVFAPYIVGYLFPGLASDSDTLVTLIRILLLQPLFLGLSSLFGVVTQLSHRFILYAVSPLLYNLGIIIGIGVLYPVFGLSGLVYGVVFGAFMHMAVQVPLVQKSALHFGYVTKINWSDIRSVLSVSIPRAFTLSMHQFVLLILVGIAGSMTVGSVAVFQFAYNLQSVPLAVIGASYSTAAFPLLADLFAQSKMDQFRLYVTTALRHIIFWSVPIIALIIVLRAQMVRVVLGSGAFDWGDTRLTAAVLSLLAISLLAQAINLLLIRAFYAAGRTSIPFMVTLFGSVLSVASVLLLYFVYHTAPGFDHKIEGLMRVVGVPGSEVMVIGLGYSIGMILQTVTLFYIAVRKFSIQVGWLGGHFLKSLLAGLVGAFFAYITLNFFVEGLNTSRFLGIFLQGVLGSLAGLVGVIGAYRLVRSSELNEIYKSVHGRMYKARIVASQDDVL